MSKGLASVKTLTVKQIADKWKLPVNVVAKKVAAGVKVEKEHTKSLRQANEIARDHLSERPDYYEKLDKMEKKPIVKEESSTGAVRGLGFVTGDPGVNYVAQYINTNAMAYQDDNGNKLDYLKKQHTDLHNSKLGYAAFDPTKIGANKNFIKEAKLNELGECDNKGGSPGYEETTGPIRAIRKREVKEQSPANVSYKERPMYEKSTGNNPMPGGADRGIYEGDAETIRDLDNKFFNKEPSLDEIGRRMKAADSGAYKDVANRMRSGIPKGVADLRSNTMYESDALENAKKRIEKAFSPEYMRDLTKRHKDAKEKEMKSKKFQDWKKGVKVHKSEKLDEISDTLVGKVSNAAFWKNRPLKTSTQRRIKVAQLRDPEEIKKENEKQKSVKEDANRPDRDLEARTYTGATGTTKTIHEETKMDNKEYINEALDCILEDNLTEMKDNLMLALQEKAMTKLEERKKEIAANYFAE